MYSAARRNPPVQPVSERWGSTSEQQNKADEYGWWVWRSTAPAIKY
jgi:hypothetical protein